MKSTCTALVIAAIFVFALPTVAEEGSPIDVLRLTDRLFERIVYSIRVDGAEAAVDFYHQLKDQHPDEYDFSKFDLLVIGDKLLEKGSLESAITFLEASGRDYPESDYAYFVNYDLAVAHKKLGNRGAALCYCRMAFELAPENENIARLLRELMDKKVATSLASNSS